MTITEFKKLIREKIVLFDGATGTELQKRGMPSGVCPEKWVIENPDSIIDIQKEYIEAGSNIICSCTFGASSLKLKENGFGDRLMSSIKHWCSYQKGSGKQCSGSRGYRSYRTVYKSAGYFII
jgi:methionine synthase I (cobalamin-dependent)